MLYEETVAKMLAILRRFTSEAARSDPPPLLPADWPKNVASPEASCKSLLEEILSDPVFAAHREEFAALLPFFSQSIKEKESL